MCDGQCVRAERGRAGGDQRVEVAGLGRRDFLASSVFAAVATLLSGSAVACGDGVIGSSGPTAPPSLGGNGLTVKLSDYPALASVGGMARVNTPSGAPLGVVRTATSTFVALSLVCPHQGSIVSMRSTGFVCPNHGATFTTDGTWVGGQQTTNLVSYPVTYDQAAGTLQISGASGTGGPTTPPTGTDDGGDD